ncbi:hypothetical protein PGTUg99_021287 [Puccinia graminis f. sp. tritici]|uniref:DUF6589 domain-containing protein n=2 Tax=Puccinia graminis f. sp. tritici TaxID=56615 RepID=A0A5B0SFJ9_PUCGR|nr:hypothetical protein PGTUg99_021287 [Puccinia graminis f. sp. tritici]
MEIDDFQSLSPPKQPRSPQAAPSDTLPTKIVEFCDFLKSNYNLTPKKFVVAFLTADHNTLAFRRRYWGSSTGWPSTLDLIQTIKKQVTKTQKGQDFWREFIKGEAIQILDKEKPPTGNYPDGCFQSSQTVEPSFFDHDAACIREESMIKHHMPFLFDTLMGTLQSSDEMQTSTNTTVDPDTEPPSDPNGVDMDEQEMMEMDGTQYENKAIPCRIKKIAATICAQVAFAKNRRCNGLQLFNSVRFMAGNVSEAVNDYLHHIGLTSSRQTAVRALISSSARAGRGLRTSSSIKNNPIISPSICIDNLDIEQRVHTHGVGHRSMMFHGTWGYIHKPNPSLLASLDHSQLTLEAYNRALSEIPTLKIVPSMFLPTAEEDNHFELVMKSQISRVMRQYIATPINNKSAIPSNPPEIDLIDCSPLDINMLKLMDASDNSADGVGQVLGSIIQQLGLTADEFCSRLQIMDGDLGTCQNINSLRALRSPSSYADHALLNITMQLGSSHTLWNISQNILTSHFGDPSKTNDLGTWQYWHALGIPSDKAASKKDFTLMMKSIEKAHEATIFYCLRVIMQTENEPVNGDVHRIPTDEWNDIIDECYSQFLSPQARRNVSKAESPKLHSILIRLHDFATIVEANRAMKAGDIGRLMNMWKIWSIMSQALTGLVNYRSYLPRMVLLLTHILPPSLSKYIRHNLLISPSGRPNHFVAKDYYLECQNYMLKFLYNRSGVGTQISTLQDLFSLNMTMLRSMYLSLKKEKGTHLIHQSHKNIITVLSLENFLRMARNNDILDQFPLD